MPPRSPSRLAGGAIIGGIVGGKKGAAIGTAVGGGAGTAVVLTTRGPQIRLDGGAVLSLPLEQGVEVRVPIAKSSAHGSTASLSRSGFPVCNAGQRVWPAYTTLLVDAGARVSPVSVEAQEDSHERTGDTLS